MSRPLRVALANATDHAVARGNERPAIVADEADRDRWSPGRRCDNIARAVAAYLGRTLARLPAGGVAAALGYRDPSSVSTACRRVEARLRQSRLPNDLAAIARKLKEAH